MSKAKKDLKKAIDAYSDNMDKLQRKLADAYALREAARTLITLDIPVPNKLAAVLAKTRADIAHLQKLTDRACLSFGNIHLEVP
jgi:hypothetical protein